MTSIFLRLQTDVTIAAYFAEKHGDTHMVNH